MKGQPEYSHISFKQKCVQIKTDICSKIYYKLKVLYLQWKCIYIFNLKNKKYKL